MDSNSPETNERKDESEMQNNAENDDNKVTVNIKTTNSLNMGPLQMEVERDLTVLEFKELIAGKMDIEPERQRLIFAGKALKNHEKLSDSNVSNGSTIHLVPRLTANTPAPGM